MKKPTLTQRLLDQYSHATFAEVNAAQMNQARRTRQPEQVAQRALGKMHEIANRGPVQVPLSAVLPRKHR